MSLTSKLALIKGGGAALLQEKIVATASDQMIVIADAAKEVEQLGAFPLPIEVIPFGWQTTKALIEEMLVSMDVLTRDVTLRMNGDRPLITDESNYILDLHLKRIGNPRQLALVLNQIPGVVENGLFIDICDIVVIGHGDGRVTVRDINAGSEPTTGSNSPLPTTSLPIWGTERLGKAAIVKYALRWLESAMTAFDYDLFVIGGGSGGVRAARIAAAEGGARVGLAEESRMGGTCVIRGCVPKKLMVYASEFAELIEEARAYGWDVGAASSTGRGFAASWRPSWTGWRRPIATR